MPDGTVFTTVLPTHSYTKAGSYLKGGEARSGIYQMLSTRSGGEVVSSEDY